MFNRHLIPLLVSFFCTILLVPLVMSIARRTNAFARSNSRRRMKDPVPLLGGAAVFLAVFITVYVFKLKIGINLVASAIPLFIIGIFDDYREFSARPKAVIQVLSAAIWVLTRAPGELVLEQVGLLHGAAVFGSIFWIVGLTNAMNLVDGIDGLAVSLTFIASMTLSFFLGHSDLSLTMGILSGAVMGFLFYNMPPARVYLGDSGSTVLGFMLSSTCCVLQLPKIGFVGILIPLLLLSYPQVDTILAIVRRLINRQHIFSGDHSHLHHKLKRIGFSTPATLGILSAVGGYSALGAYAMWGFDKPAAVLVLALTVLGLLGALTIILLWDRILGQKIADHAHGVVGRFLANQNSRMGTTRKFAGLLLDLNRCYFEFQHFSAARVEDFARDFSVLLRKFFPGEILKAGDKNSVIVYFAQSVRISERLLSELRGALRELLKEYGALDNEEETLESMVLTLSGQTRTVGDETSGTREAA